MRLTPLLTQSGHSNSNTAKGVEHSVFAQVKAAKALTMGELNDMNALEIAVRAVDLAGRAAQKRDSFDVPSRVMSVGTRVKRAWLGLG
jgi:hypothetical protein